MWIYGDYGLVHAILSEDRTEWDAVMPIVRRLSDRLLAFMGNSNLVDNVEAFQTRVLKGS